MSCYHKKIYYFGVLNDASTSLPTASLLSSSTRYKHFSTTFAIVEGETMDVWFFFLRNLRRLAIPPTMDFLNIR
ncbi:hypothetical protein CR513_19713, partial [Mucuna pruriens]